MTKHKLKNNKTIVIILAILLLVIIGVGIAIILITTQQDPTQTQTAEQSYVIQFDSNGGVSIDDINFRAGETIKLPIPTREGYIFDGWYDGDNLVAETIAPEGDLRLKANWRAEEVKKKTAKISFDASGGSSVAGIEYQCGKGVSLPANPSRSDYSFEGWTTKDGIAVKNGAILACEDITLYANWKKHQSASTPSKPSNPTTPTQPTTPSQPSEPKYTCPADYQLNGDKCISSVAAQKKCPNGYVSYVNNQCINMSTSVPTIGDDQCPAGYDILLMITLGGEDTYACYPVTNEIYYCAEGYTLNGTTCTSTIDATKSN